MILLETVNELDYRILSIIGIYVTLLLKPLKAKFIEDIQATIIQENEKSHDKLIYKADKLINKRSLPKREKTYIKRVFSEYQAEYHPSIWVRTISGMSSICLGYCVFLLLAVFTYSIIQHPCILSSVISSSILTLVATFIFVWLVYRADYNTDFAFSFNFLSLIYGLLPIVIGVIIGIILGVLIATKITSIPETITNALIYASFWIPFIPISITFISTTWVYWKKYKSCSLLKKTLEDFDSGKLSKQLQSTNP